MRFAVLSDIHGNLTALNAVLADSDSVEGQFDAVICLGDIVGHAAHPNEVVDVLRARDVQAIRGNFDDFVTGQRSASGSDYTDSAHEQDDRAAAEWTRAELTAGNRAYLEALPADSRIEVLRSGRATGKLRESESEANRAKKGFLGTMMLGTAILQMGEKPKRLQPRRLRFVHGSPRDSIENLYPDSARSILETIGRRADADVILHGHTHQPYEREVGGVAFVGAGSVGWPRIAGLADYAIVDCRNFELSVEFRAVEYDAGREADDAERSGLPERYAAVLRHGYLLQPVR